MSLRLFTVLALHDPDSQAPFLFHASPFNILFLALAMKFYASVFCTMYTLAHSFNACICSFIYWFLILHLLSIYYLPGNNDAKCIDIIFSLKNPKIQVWNITAWLFKLISLFFSLGFLNVFAMLSPSSSFCIFSIPSTSLSPTPSCLAFYHVFSLQPILLLTGLSWHFGNNLTNSLYMSIICPGRKF